MRHLSTLLSLLLFTACTVVYADGVHFFQGSWAQLMAEAKRQNKPVFVDVYTTWCVPCKLMTSQAFPNARVASRMNDNFINYKLDAEKGSGPSIVQRYGVQGYPTSLFLTSEGKLIRRSIGYNGVEGFLGEVRKALSDAQGAQAMIVWNNKYDAGERSRDFLRNMLLKQTEYDRATGDVLDDYVKTIPKADTLANDEIKFLSDMLATTYTKAYQLLAQQSVQVVMNPTKRYLAAGLIKAFARAERNDFNDAVAAQDEILLEGLIKNQAAREQAARLGGASPEQKAMQEREADNTRLRFYKASRLPAHYIALAKKIAETRLMTKAPAELAKEDSVVYARSKPLLAMTSTLLPDSVNKTVMPVLSDSSMKRAVSRVTANQLSELAMSLSQHSADKKDLGQALRWSERAVLLDNCPENVVTYAKLLIRNGRRAEAQKQLREAIAREQAGSDSVNRLRAELVRMK